MSRKRESTVSCPRCSHIIRCISYESITASINPELKEEILKGTFGKIECSECGEIFYLHTDLLYHDPAVGYMICVGTDYSDAMKAFDRIDSYQYRYVDNFMQLAEKILIFEDLVNDRVVEVAKCMTKDITKEKEDLYYYRMKDDELIFILPKSQKLLSISSKIYYMAIELCESFKEETNDYFLKIDEQYVRRQI